MPIRKTEFRRGLQRQIKTSFDFPLTDEEMTEFNHEFDSMSMDATLRDYEEFARRVLREAHLPDHLALVRVLPNGTWQELPNNWQKNWRQTTEDARSRVRFMSVTALVKGRELTAEWRAAQILHWVAAVRHHIAEGNTEDAAWTALRLQNHVTKAEFVDNWESHAVRGLKTLESARVGGNQRARVQHASVEAKHERWNAEARRIWIRKPDLSKVSIAAIIPRRNRDGASNTIRQVIKQTDE
jgi:hypothetical protein